MKEKKTHAGLPRSLEKLLIAATGNAMLREELLRDRSAAAERWGYELGESERAMLQAIPRAQLLAILDRLTHHAPSTSQELIAAPTGIRPDGVHGRELVKGIRPGRILIYGAVASAVAGGGVMMISMGNRPDAPEVQQVQSAADQVQGTGRREQRDGGPDGGQQAPKDRRGNDP